MYKKKKRNTSDEWWTTRVSQDWKELHCVNIQYVI
jgi:hypothetical protein